MLWSMLWFLTLSFTDNMKDDEEYEHSPREFYHPDEDSTSIEASGITESYMEWNKLAWVKSIVFILLYAVDFLASRCDLKYLFLFLCIFWN